MPRLDDIDWPELAATSFLPPPVAAVARAVPTLVTMYRTSNERAEQRNAKQPPIAAFGRRSTQQGPFDRKPEMSAVQALALEDPPPQPRLAFQSSVEWLNSRIRPIAQGLDAVKGSPRPRPWSQRPISSAHALPAIARIFAKAVQDRSMTPANAVAANTVDDIEMIGGDPDRERRYQEYKARRDAEDYAREMARSSFQ